MKITIADPEFCVQWAHPAEGIFFVFFIYFFFLHVELFWLSGPNCLEQEGEGLDPVPLPLATHVVVVRGVILPLGAYPLLDSPLIT